MKNSRLSQNEDYSLFESTLCFLKKIFGSSNQKEEISTSNSQKKNKLNPTQTGKIKAFLL